MTEKKLIIFLACMLLLTLSLQSCQVYDMNPDEDIPAATADVGYASGVVNPVGAITEIYAGITIKDVQDITPQVLNDQFGIAPEDYRAVYGRYSSGKYGVADVFIFDAPDEYSQEILLEKLEEVKLSRMMQFKDYDIYDAYQNAEEAEVFVRGDYVVMIMLPGSEAAREVAEAYLPVI